MKEDKHIIDKNLDLFLCTSEATSWTFGSDGENGLTDTPILLLASFHVEILVISSVLRILVRHFLFVFF